MNEPTPDVAANLAAVRATIGADVTLIAVSKGQPDDRIAAALAAGQRVFGENRVQEAQTRWAARRATHPDLVLHLIGPLQTNKVRQAVALFDVIHTLDRPRLAEALAAEFARTERRLPCLVQVNIGEEPQKAGVAPAEAEAFARDCRERLGLPIEGLMCIPQAEGNPAPHFALLREMARRLSLPMLSMGMSGDYAIAMRFGATHVRVGSAIFGARSHPVTSA